MHVQTKLLSVPLWFRPVTLLIKSHSKIRLYPLNDDLLIMFNICLGGRSGSRSKSRSRSGSSKSGKKTDFSPSFPHHYGPMMRDLNLLNVHCPMWLPLQSFSEKNSRIVMLGVLCQVSSLIFPSFLTS